MSVALLAEPTASRLSPWQFRKVLRQMDANLADGMQDGRDGRAAGTERRILLARLPAGLGAPPHTFILQRRLARAMATMRASARGLSEIAQDCGNCDQPHLTKCFRRVLGTSPAA
ncbi:helix-turn-helix domain-containing protein [Roseomonas sp. GCM10028921]